jgi:hypothetical protein
MPNTRASENWRTIGKSWVRSFAASVEIFILENDAGLLNLN